MIKSTSKLVALMLFCGVAQAGINVGVVDVIKVVDNSHQMADMRASIKKQFDGRHAAVEKEQKALQKTLDELNRSGVVMSKKDKAALAKKMEQQRKHLMASQASLQHDVMAARDKSFNKLVIAVKAAIEKVAKAEGYDLVLTKQSIAYLKDADSRDVTAHVIKALS